MSVLIYRYSISTLEGAIEEDTHAAEDDVGAAAVQGKLGAGVEIAVI